MIFDDWAFQDKILNDARALMHRQVNRILIQSETGSGKTVMGTRMFAGCLQRQKQADFFVHRKELIKQTAKTFQKAGLPFGITAAGMHCGESELIQLCSIQTTCKMERRKPFMAVVDEAHHITANSYQTISGDFLLGLSATPADPKGNGLGKWFTHMINGPTIPELQAMGMLSEYKYFAPVIPDLSEVETYMGEYSQQQIEQIMEGKSVVGSILGEWMKHGQDLVTIGFAPSIKASMGYVDLFNSMGFKAAHIDGKMGKTQRDDICESYCAGETQLLWNVGICEEGFDIGAYGDGSLTIECLIDAAPTKSLRKSRQVRGRVLRRKPRPAVILDYAGNFTRHGMPCDVIRWTLEGECKLLSRGFTVTQCPNCFLVFKNSENCPHCGDRRETKERKVIFTEGELREIKKSDALTKKMEAEKIKQQKKRELKACRTEDDLLKYAMKWDVENPKGWARMRYRFKQEYKQKFRRK